ncbi:MAG: hypothetical protein UR69_C0001G0171 [Candidatus Moranbacteria bacterium GW2011_GWE2_35_2-]|nr:MAG: hypothetical protein UR69_C0001G0171 [Candidatus Moranbacteria bacterium GW2011_GWE2_35_2-]KKQ06245.1 MAG: hypothetical protein US15_C0015G0010 [Candidatus Moranbacteria bacterium GW2011_GWF1_36_4]KKQ22831.1 MAG: hypothetical protein US37_C0001G0103 [Candidatus Moranbacteria bacterium GW2011_GWF2_37_11]KKQ28657.1 MAG: hypothetical protein US44_C0008G0031 [Candidatus Moranbacteria bacterium GW2011_GWD1_37_17]KKQ30938.1 MAG: hypothetical protein US47_C0001G0171 [Candidatus Moranbacteria b
MTDKAKLIRTIYLYLASLISLLFVAIGAGRILNTALKYYVFPKAEKGGYSQCDVQPPIYALDKSNLERVATDDQKIQLENLLRDYEQWKKGNSGDECYSQERQKNVVDALTMLIVALPIFGYHWNVIKKEKKKEE